MNLIRFFALNPALVAFLLIAGSFVQAEDWVSLFDGKSLAGWERNGDIQSRWVVEEGEIRGSGPASMLVSTTGPYKNFRYRAEIKINDGGNSGMYFRTTRHPDFTSGYEAQICSTHTDPIRTGSLYGMCHVYDQLTKPDTWFLYEVEVRDDTWRGRQVTKIRVKIDGKEIYEFLDFDNLFGPGHFAFQQHDPGSKVSIRNVQVLELPNE